MDIDYGRKTYNDSYGRHAISDIATGPADPFDVWPFIRATGLHPTRLADNYVGRHQLEGEDGERRYPCVYLDAYRGWVRELPDFHGDWYGSEQVTA